MLLNQTDIAGLQPPEVAEVLVRWRDRLDGHFERAAAAYDAQPRLPTAHVVGKLGELHQVFATTIPAVRVQREGWRDKLDLLLKELRDAGVLEP